MTALERMGGPHERRIEGAAADFPASAVADFNTLAIECVPEPGAALLSTAPGLPDAAFDHDGQLTKREVRAATLAALAPVPNQLLWDVGAGCGSVAIEWMRAASRARAIAIERTAARAALIAANAAALGTPLLRAGRGRGAGGARWAGEDPDAIFVGGGVSAPGLLSGLLGAPRAGRPSGRQRGDRGGRARADRLARSQRWRRLTRIAVSRAEPVGRLTGWRPLMPVTQLAALKP